jgi:non-ribosomal peptide synthetase component E (peptide arylation enzyme)
MIQEYTDRGYWTSTTFADLWDRNAREYPHKEAVADSQTRLTWSEAKQWIDRMALGLLELGFKKDDVLAVQLPNSVELCLFRVVCEKAGLLCLPLIRTLRHREMEHILSFVEATGIVIPWKLQGFDYFEMVKEIQPNLIQPNLPQLKHIFVAGDEVPEGASSLQEMIQRPLEEAYPPDYLEERKCGAIEVALIPHTSGTTGFPKFVEYPICSYVYQGRSFSQFFGFTGDEVFAILGPAAAGPNIRAYICGPYVAARIVMMERFDAEEALKLIDREKVTVTGVVPAQLAMMLSHPNFHQYNLTSLRMIFSSGASLPYQLGIATEERIGCPVVQSYGSVDWGGGTGGSRLEAPRDKRLLTVGQSYGGNEIKIVDDTGKEVARGEVGEIMVKGPSSASGYYKDPEATWQAWSKDGWLKLGDLGKLDEEGNLMVIGRKKDVIIRAGQNIYPVEVENLIVTHPKVSAAALVSMPDPVMGERACAYVTLRSGQSFTFEEMVSCLRGKNIASYKLPERLEIVDKFPTVAEGQKVDKKVLQQDIAQKLKEEGKI